jgi:hypothetical protein
MDLILFMIPSETLPSGRGMEKRIELHELIGHLPLPPIGVSLFAQ